MFSFFKPVPQISVEELKKIIAAKKSYTLIDVRSAYEYEEGHIPGSINISLDRFPESFMSKYPDKEATYYINCQSGGRSTQAVHVLQAQGYTKAINVTGGMLAWNV